MKSHISIFLVLMLVCGILAGCTGNTQQPANDPNEPEYIMDYAWDAHSYCLYVNKELTVVLNQLSTHMLLARQVGDGYTIDNALLSAKASLEAIRDAKKQLEIMPAPAQYVENRENTLRLVALAEQDMEEWVEILEAARVDSTKLTSVASRMQADFVAITAEFNIYYK